jgi:hypothetical protein
LVAAAAAAAGMIILRADNLAVRAAVAIVMRALAPPCSLRVPVAAMVTLVLVPLTL